MIGSRGRTERNQGASPISEAQKRKIISLAKAGLRDREIADETGATEGQVTACRQKCGVSGEHNKAAGRGAGVHDQSLRPRHVKGQEWESPEYFTSQNDAFARAMELEQWRQEREGRAKNGQSANQLFSDCQSRDAGQMAGLFRPGVKKLA